MKKREAEEKIQIAFVHYGYMLKRSCVEIIQFFELFLKYEIFNRYTGVGMTEELKWESLVESYLEKSHNYIEKQRRVYTNINRAFDLNLDDARTNIIQPVTLEHKVITKLRNSNHHSELFITAFYQRSDMDGMSAPIPALRYYLCELNEDEKRFTNELENNKDGVVKLFTTHCEQFITKSNKMKGLLMEHLA